MAGRPKGSINSKKETPKIKCTGECERELVETKFYMSDSPMFPSGRVPLCKDCIKKLINNDDINSVYSVLQVMDIPFFYDYWQACVEKNPTNPFGNYVRMANSRINQFKGARWKDSTFEKNIRKEETQSEISSLKYDLIGNFKPTRDMLVRWGTKYSPEQYIKLENFYQDMKLKNNIETPQEEDYLKKLAVISLKLDEELEAGNYSQAKSLGDLFSKYMADSKFRAMDKTEADKTGGIRNFGMIYAEVESDDFIPPWEHYRKIKGLTQDIIDKAIMHIENFTLRLNKIEKMTEPPRDTPKLEPEETTINLTINGDD